MSRKRGSDSVIVEIATAFRELPLIAALVAAPVSFLLLGWALPAFAAATAPAGSPTGLVVVAVAKGLGPLIGGLLAAGILIAGVGGAIERRVAGRRGGGVAAASGRTGRPAAGPRCPTCGSEMRLRTARRGSSAGSSFWGCSTYPACRATLPVG